MGAYPMLSDLLPMPAPSAALILLPCPECQGESECSCCGESGMVEVCGSCLQAPEIICGNEICACTFPVPAAATDKCENCGNFNAVTDNLCSICWGATLHRIKEEEDPNLQAWQELKARDMTPAEVAEQMKEAQAWGWI